MDIYERIAPYYDEFFPQNPKATSFLLDAAGASGESGPPRVVDFGCATGSQVLALAEAGWGALGCEPCDAMLTLARRKAREQALPASFEPWPMLEAASRLERRGFDLALCLGNTLPYLADEEELGRFAGDLARLLAPGGSVVLQLLNYAKLAAGLAESEYRFPPLRSGGAVFDRSYAAAPDGAPVFRVELEEDGRRFSESSRLAPFSRDAIASRLSAAGFAEPRSISGWDGVAFDPETDAYLVVVARMPG